jgi:[acyl-carrier-protein] S-malonyltransferase
MRPAAEAMAEALAAATIAPPRVPVVANVTAAPVSDPDAIRDLLVRQVTGLVRWRECVMALKTLGATSLVECGSGKVLTGLAKRIEPDLTALALGAPADIEAFAKTV